MMEEINGWKEVGLLGQYGWSNSNKDLLAIAYFKDSWVVYLNGNILKQFKSRDFAFKYAYGYMKQKDE